MRRLFLGTILMLVAACVPKALAPVVTTTADQPTPPQTGAAARDANAAFTATAIAHQVSTALAATAKALETPIAPPVPTATKTPVPPTATNTPRPQPTQTPAPVLGRLGENITAGNWSYTVQEVRRMKQYQWSDYGSAETAIGEFVMVLMQIANVGNQNFGIRDADFQIYDRSNIKYEAKSFAFGFDQWLMRNGRQALCNQCPPGVVFNTGIIFDVAPGAPSLRLRLVQAKRDVALP